MTLNDEYFDRCRTSLQYLRVWSYDPRRKLLPGDIASCRGSVEIALYQVLAQHGFPLKPWQKTKGTAMPFRYCVINKPLKDNEYEVFLLTTFGDVRSAERLSVIGKFFGLPLGNTPWINDLQPLQTNPPIQNLGLHRKSFVFAIPFIASIEHNTDQRVPYGGRVRLLGSDLQRLRAFSKLKTPLLLSNREAILKDLYRHKSGSQSVDSKDTPNDIFSPTRYKFEPSLEDLSEGIQEWEFKKSHHTRVVAPQMFPLRERLDFRWLSRYAFTDIRSASAFLRKKLSRQPIGKKLPLPYYAICLRAGVKKFARLLR